MGMLHSKLDIIEGVCAFGFRGSSIEGFYDSHYALRVFYVGVVDGWIMIESNRGRNRIIRWHKLTFLV